MNLPKVTIHSDWWARPNPWVWGYWVILSYKDIKKEFSKWYKMTTNNRMELMWAITGLEKLKKKSQVDLYTDSQYTINWIEKWWAVNWKAKNWMRTKSQKAVNYDLWDRLLKVVEKHEVRFHWVKWHNWHEENERCDELATEALKWKKLLEDNWFDWEVKQTNLLDNKKNKEKELIKVLNENLSTEQKKMKITKNWQACKKCGTPVEKKIPKKKNTKNKSFYYEYYLSCPWCKTMYMVDDAKIML